MYQKIQVHAKSYGNTKLDDLSSNPFACSDNDIFIFLNKQLKEKEEERKLNLHLKAWDKTTSASRARCQSNSSKKILLELDEHNEKPEDVEEDKQKSPIKCDPKWALLKARRIRVEKDTLSDYINQTREMFLAQYAAVVKQDAIMAMKETVQKEEKKITDAEKKLENETIVFEEFLKENDRNAVEALKIADQETKSKLEKNAEIRKASVEMMAIKSDIARCEEIITEYIMYEAFLRKLSPPEWQESQKQKKLSRTETKGKEKDRKRTVVLPAITKKQEGRTTRLMSRAETTNDHRPMSYRKTSVSDGRRSSVRSQSISPKEQAVDDRETLKGDSDSEEEPELYFTDPQQLLQIFAELEEQNLTLIQNSQDYDDTLQEIKAKYNVIKEKMYQKISSLEEHRDVLTAACTREEDKIKDLEMKSKMCSFGDLNPGEQDILLSQLSTKIVEVYRSCIGEVQSSTSTLQMLTRIEKRLEELFNKLESTPRAIVEAAEKNKQKERRIRLRKEKLKLQMIQQEERLLRALARATAEPKKRMGRKLMIRSDPPSRKPKKSDTDKLTIKQQEEFKFFFS
ncbi:coiled-coil domain-containing protein 38 [Discoglossus pictus]